MPSASTEDTQPLVTVTLSDPQCAHGHRFGINAFASSDNGELFTAGRDGTVRCWDALPTGNAAQPAVVNAEAHRTLEGHSDWVNDLALLQSDVLVSCSSDCTVRLWPAAPLLSSDDPHNRPSPADMTQRAHAMPCRHNPARPCGVMLT